MRLILDFFKTKLIFEVQMFEQDFVPRGPYSIVLL